jgi:DNA-binding transcriptional MerR regulator
MASLFTIGEFSRATHLSVKALRYYDEVGLLTPADTDPGSGYRRYAVAQVPVAQVIRRFRDLEMPLDRIKDVLAATDRTARDRVVLEHLEQMQAKLEETQATVAALQGLLEARSPGAQAIHRTLPAAHAVSIRDRVDWQEAERWLGDALAELAGALKAADVVRAGPNGALYSTEFFEYHDGDVVAFVPVPDPIAGSGRVEPFEFQACTCAVMVHHGPFTTLDMTYGALGSYVTERAIGALGPIRENYVIDNADDPADLVTEVCWPVTE